jgi:hypothetical protein
MSARSVRRRGGCTNTRALLQSLNQAVIEGDKDADACFAEQAVRE